MIKNIRIEDSCTWDYTEQWI